MIRLRFLTATAVLIAVASRPGRAQNAFQVSVTPQALSQSGDTVSIAYTVRVLPSASGSLVSFIVDAPSSFWVALPGARTDWLLLSRYKQRQVASWISLLKVWNAGDSTPPLPMRARGMLGVVNYWAEKQVPSPTVDSELVSNPATDTVVDVPGVQGTTIGVVNFPADMSSGALAVRLGTLIDQVCAMGWIDNHGICNSLSAKAKPQAGPLGALLNELGAQRGKHVSEAAYQLLSFNAQFLLARL